MTVKILSIDGGGIRGIIPAMVMAEIERRTGKPISQLFDLIAGTSTGGVLALGVARPDPNDPRKPLYSAVEGVELYEQKGPRIFSRTLLKTVKSLGGLTDEKYFSEPVETVLQEQFGSSRLRDALTNVMITSYEIERRFPWFFRSYKAKNDPAYDFPMWQVARATSAAPTYFEPCKIETDSAADYYALVDGGVFANNPTICAFVDARTYLEVADDYLVVSLGTGTASQPLPYDHARNWGAAEWVRPVLSILMAGVSDTVDYQMDKLLNTPGSRPYYRLQVKLRDEVDLDDAQPENVRQLKLIAEDLIHQRSRDIDEICARL
jgi:patatin-like phospholipase/acyl hydrolase